MRLKWCEISVALPFALAGCGGDETFNEGNEGEAEAEGECAPGGTVCDGDIVRECNPDGTPGAVVMECDVAAGDTCVGGLCLNPCDAAAASNSYIGCEYWPTVTINSHLGEYGGDFQFAVAIGNPNSLPANVTVERGGANVVTTTVDPGAVETIVLPWVDELLQRGAVATEVSGAVADGAYRLRSTVPVTAYQFNPLAFYPVGGKCDPASLTPTCSFSNDASLLLPTPTLDNNYIAIARPTFSVGGVSIPGFLSVVGVQDETQVTITFSANTQAGGGLGAYAPGDTESFSLDEGDVLQIVSGIAFTSAECADTSVGTCEPLAGGGEACHGGTAWDLTGTRIESNHAVAVFSGHACTFIPYNKWACDHNEEQMFPLATWGTSIIAASTEPQVAEEPNVWKLVSGSDGNTIGFEPALMGDVTLDAGQYVEFEYQGAFRVSSGSNGRIALAQFMVGEDYNGTLCPPGVGDPAMGLAVPYDQFRTGYDFLTPETYTTSYVIVLSPMDSIPTLDGSTLPAQSPIASTGFGFVRVEVAPGAHHIESSIDPQPFGIMVSGIAPYASYLYPGGLDLELLPIE